MVLVPGVGAVLCSKAYHIWSTIAKTASWGRQAGVILAFEHSLFAACGALLLRHDTLGAHCRPRGDQTKPPTEYMCCV